MGTILTDVKAGLGVDENNLGFDDEILIHINGALAEHAQNGVSQLDGILIAAETEWPAFDNAVILNLIRPCVILQVRKQFDPIPSETIARGVAETITTYMGRIAHEIDEVTIL